MTPQPKQINELSRAVAAKYDLLLSSLRTLLADGLIVAFSGGVDSAFLLWAAEQERLKNGGGRLLALTTSSDSLASSERSDVERFIASTSVDHLWQVSGELEDEAYLINDANRCYRCKTELFRICSEVARDRGFANIAYGYNASDKGDIRPGHLAAVEGGIHSPLADADLTKEDIRELMRFFGMKMADKPASPCLSSRIVTGVAITPAKLKAVDEMEAFLRGQGLNTFRVRVHESGGEKMLRLEAAENEMETAFAMREVVVQKARELGFRWTTIDLAGYRTGGGNAAS